MQIKKKFLSKYLHTIALEQIADEYIKKGYTVSREEKIGSYQADIIARNGDEQIVIEVKAGKMTEDKKKQIAGIADYINNIHGYKFLVVVATSPKEKQLEIGELDQLISAYMLNDLPDELDALSTHTRPDYVSDIVINSIIIKGELIFVSGSGVVTVELQFGSDGDQSNDDGIRSTDNFPFNYSFTLRYNKDKKLEIYEVDEFEIDTSSYYDNE